MSDLNKIGGPQILKMNNTKIQTGADNKKVVDDNEFQKAKKFDYSKIKDAQVKDVVETVNRLQTDDTFDYCLMAEGNYIGVTNFQAQHMVRTPQGSKEKIYRDYGAGVEVTGFIIKIKAKSDAAYAKLISGGVTYSFVEFEIGNNKDEVCDFSIVIFSNKEPNRILNHQPGCNIL